MKPVLYSTTPAAPPNFDEARFKRHKARAAGMDPDYWYPVDYASALRNGQTTGATFWNTPIVVYRGTDGALGALEDRCAHRQVRLSAGEVDGCNLTCTYHGWTYNREGRVVHYAHDLFGRARPEVRIRHFPVTERHGLIWVFPGDPDLAADRHIPGIPELEGARPWARIDASFTWNAHHSMIIDNVSDFSHAYLHRKYRPFWDAKLTHYSLEGDTVSLGYDTHIGGGRISGLFVDRARADTTKIELRFEYPYQCSQTGGTIKHWCFILPIDRSTTKVFFIFYFDAFRVPGTTVRLPRPLMDLAMNLGSRLSVRPLLAQDGAAIELEQTGYDTHFRAPIVELNPAVLLFQDLTIRKWEEYLERERARREH